MKILLPILFFLSINLNGQTLDSIAYAAIMFDIESKVKLSEKKKKWKKGKYKIREEINGEQFFRKEIYEEGVLIKYRYWNNEKNGLLVNVVELLVFEKELIYGKEIYSKNKKMYTEYYFHQGMNITVRAHGGVRLVVDDDEVKYGEWFEKVLRTD